MDRRGRWQHDTGTVGASDKLRHVDVLNLPPNPLSAPYSITLISRRSRLKGTAPCRSLLPSDPNPLLRARRRRRRTRTCECCQLVPSLAEADRSAHLGGERRQSPATGANGASSGKVSNPLAGLVPRKVTVEQAKVIMVSYRGRLARADGRTASTTRSRTSLRSPRSTRRSCGSARRSRSMTRCTSSSRSSRTTRSL